MTEWTKEPPTEPGWYWCKTSGHAMESFASPAKVDADGSILWDGYYRARDAIMGLRWWPEPIPPPMTNEKRQ